MLKEKYTFSEIRQLQKLPLAEKEKLSAEVLMMNDGQLMLL